MDKEIQFSEIQLRLLSTLFFLTKGNRYAITGRVIAYWLQGAWSDYRHKQMKQLEKAGAVVCRKVPLFSGSKVSKWFYHLTPDCKTYLEEALSRSLEGQREEIPSDLLF